MKISYTNMPRHSNKFTFWIRYHFNLIRTWYYFKIRWPWVKYHGFVRVLSSCYFDKRQIEIGHNVQFGKETWVSTDVIFGNNILIAGKVCFVGRHDHRFNHPGTSIWESGRGEDELIIVGNDVWIGTNATIIAGVKIEHGAIIGAGSLVNKDIPSCEIWGGVPARKIKDRFESNSDKEFHLRLISNSKL